jgi:hypothetical protein
MMLADAAPLKAQEVTAIHGFAPVSGVWQSNNT